MTNQFNPNQIGDEIYSLPCFLTKKKKNHYIHSVLIPDLFIWPTWTAKKKAFAARFGIFHLEQLG